MRLPTAPSDDPGARRQFAVLVVLVSLVVAGIGAAAVAGSLNSGADPTPAAQRGESVNATTRLDRLHDAGVTGANVTVGVVGVTGFDTDHPSIEGRVTAARSFARGETIRNGGRTDHGTAAASIVAATAPDADLVLASFDTAAEFHAAVAWLLDREVDVIVAPVAFYGKAGDGSSPVARTTALAAEQGVTVVAPAGNLGRGRWAGSFDPTAAGIHQFPGGTRNFLTDRVAGSRRVTLWLSWDGPSNGDAAAGTDTDGALFTAELYRVPDAGGSARLVARTRPFVGDGTPNARLRARIAPDGTYFVRLRGSNESAGARVTLASPTHALQYRTRAGSVVAPATAAPVVSVGAYDPTADRVEPFSSAGPIDDRPGVDVVAPDRLRAATTPGGLVGSSAAAPYVAGVVALLLDAEPQLPPDRVETRLEATARDVAAPGTDPVAGHGLVVPDRAVPDED
jgi:hypothetical protein